MALEYDKDEHRAPRVSALGKSELAAEMQKIARRYGVPITENAELAAQLADLELEEEIPAESYKAVAKILSDIEN